MVARLEARLAWLSDRAQPRALLLLCRQLRLGYCDRGLKPLEHARMLCRLRLALAPQPIELRLQRLKLHVSLDGIMLCARRPLLQRRVVDAVVSQRSLRCGRSLLCHVGAPVGEVGVAHAPLVERAALLQLLDLRLESSLPLERALVARAAKPRRRRLLRQRLPLKLAGSGGCCIACGVQLSNEVAPIITDCL